MFNKMGNPMFRKCLIARTGIDYQSTVSNKPRYAEMNEPDTIIESVKEEIHLVLLVRKQRYHIIKMIPNGIFFAKVFGYSDLRYIFAVRKGGAIAQSVEQWTENPCVPGSIPGGTTLKGRPINIGRPFLIQGITCAPSHPYCYREPSGQFPVVSRP